VFLLIVAAVGCASGGSTPAAPTAKAEISPPPTVEKIEPTVTTVLADPESQVATPTEVPSPVVEPTSAPAPTAAPAATSTPVPTATPEPTLRMSTTITALPLNWIKTPPSPLQT
jgi:hypothetical protein